MYSGAIIFREAGRTGQAMPAEKVFEIATLHGARCALQEADLGSLEAGKKADIVLFDATRPEWRPRNHPVANLVFAADGHSIDTVIIDGQVVLEQGHSLTIDENESCSTLNELGSGCCLIRGGRRRSNGPS